jgi:hypothetical protein
MLGNGDSGVNPAVDAILSTIREQKAHYVTYRSTCMREDNHDIKAAATLAPGACNPIHSFKPINIQCFTEGERLVAGLAGIEFPKETATIEWPAHNVKTYKPFTIPPEGDHKARLLDQFPVLRKFLYIQGRILGRHNGQGTSCGTCYTIRPICCSNRHTLRALYSRR